MKPPLIKQLDLAMSDKSPAVRLACRIVLGRELQHLKQEGGYEGGGTYHSFRDRFKPGERLTWPQYCLAQAGISERTATLYYQCGEAVMVRLRCLRRPGCKDVLRKMEKQPSKMTAAERVDMIQKIIILGLTKGETQSQLLREYQGVCLPTRLLSGGECSDQHQEDETCSTLTAGGRSLDGVIERLLPVMLKECQRRRELGIKSIWDELNIERKKDRRRKDHDLRIF